MLNTDAEGRLVLGDALWYARQLGATHLVDVATLTGACVVALGKTTSGLFGTPTAWVEQVRRASERAGDRSWPMPIFDDYKEQFKSEIADFTNTGGRAGGAITAALFIKEFAGDLPWVHLDIAGTAWAEEAKPYQPKGATGVGVRTLVELALDAAAWSKLNLRRLIRCYFLLASGSRSSSISRSSRSRRSDISIDVVLGDVRRWPGSFLLVAARRLRDRGRRDRSLVQAAARRQRRPLASDTHTHIRLRI